jgi:hypothetical protein
MTQRLFALYGINAKREDVAMTAEVVGTTTFCDDVRHERGNKYSLMGCYGQEMILDSLPVVLARLCAKVTILIPFNSDTNDVVVQANLNDDVIAEMLIKAADIDSMLSEARERRTDGARGVKIAVFMTFSPLSVESPSAVIITTDAGNGPTRAGALEIRLRMDTDPQF